MEPTFVHALCIFLLVSFKQNANHVFAMLCFIQEMKAGVWHHVPPTFLGPRLEF